jgi:predicted acylesterase/phospholipase RssA/CRP-like cAMP-binding protein
MGDQDRSQLSALLPDLLSADLFGRIGPAALAELEGELSFIDLPQGARLFTAGDPGDALYFVAHGMLEVTLVSPDGVPLRLDVLEPGDSAGETGLLSGQPRSATISAMIDSQVIRLSPAGYLRLAQRHPAAMEAFLSWLLPRVRRTQLAAALATLFGPLEARAMHAIQGKVSWQHLAAGAELMRQGEPGDSMYIVINGRLRILHRAEGTVETDLPETLGDATRGETIGEFALLTGEPRTATVVAVRDSDLACLSRADLEGFLEAYPRLALPMMRAIVRRSQAQLKSNATATSNLALIPATRGVDLAAFSQQLAGQLEAAGKTLLLTSQRFDELFGRAGAAQLPEGHPGAMLVNGWLSAAEQNQRYLIFAADPTLSEWTRRCLRQADRLVLAADASGELDPALAQPEVQAAWRRCAPDLVLIHSSTAPHPTGTARWLERLAPRSLQHVRAGAPRDFSRLARCLTGRGVGLVLSGGGARGFAHLGAIRAIEEAGLEIDLIGGTSMGALMGAAYAMDWSPAEMLEMARTVTAPGKLLDYTLPYTSLVASNKVSRLLKNLFGEVQIEDLWRSYFCLSTNLSKAEPVIHRTGSLWQGVRASIAIPGIFAPLLQEGDLLVDGGVMNNFPVDVMRQSCEGGFVIGVNASPKREKVRSYVFGPGVSGWQLIWSWINPFAPKVRAPSILSSLIRATEASSVYRNTFLQREADLLISPAVGEYGSLAFGEYESIIEQGYQAAKLKLNL